MLQQTQVDAVLPYFARFMGAFPSLEALASAKERQVLGLWSGLGYYSRARNLLAAARVVARDHAGELPGDYDALRDLPGIGRYTAGAILSIAFNKPYPIVDGNVRRVLSRVHGWPEAPAERLWEAAAALVLRAEPRLVNQGLMELGATVCSFRAPRCLSCPIQTDCSAFKTGRQAEIPQPRRRPATEYVQLHAILECRGSRYRMRSAKGLWEFPFFKALPAVDCGPAPVAVGHCRHTVTHHRLDVAVYTGKLEAEPDLKWKDPDAVPISSLTRKILAVLRA
jgi:A/G-specific adenine glycosylase